MNNKPNGFSLLEILITLTIITILFAIAIPTYSNHITNANRFEAEIGLSKLATALEEYYTLNNTYKNSSPIILPTLKNYQLEITTATDSSFSLAAHPLQNQAKNDINCATLTINSHGEKGITGSGNIEECW